MKVPDSCEGYFLVLFIFRIICLELLDDAINCSSCGFISPFHSRQISKCSHIICSHIHISDSCSAEGRMPQY